MIIKMSKYAFMVYHRDYDSFLSTLRDLGVVHVKETNSILDNNELQDLIAERKHVAQAIRFCKNINEHRKDVVLCTPTIVTKAEGLALVDNYEDLLDHRARINSAISSIEKDIDYMDIWGDFSYTTINKLKAAGYVVTFFTCPTTKYEPKWGEEYNAFLVNNFQSVTYFVTVTKPGTHIEIDADRPKMPEMSLGDLQHKYNKLVDKKKNIDSAISEFAETKYNDLIELDKLIENEFNLSNTLVQTDKEAGDKLMILEGFVPTEDASEMESALEKDGYYFHEIDIEENDKVPIKLKNSKFAKLYEPITKMFSLPNYAEFDPTPFFAPFFMLFFGLCFGDGGYGLLVVIACTILKRKVNPDYKPYLTLFQYLGGAAMLVGLCTGSFFGIELAKIKMFSDVKDYFVSTDNLMTFSIIIGLVQILFGKTIAAFKIMSKKGKKYGIAPLAWVFVIIALCCVFGLPMLNFQLPKTIINIFYGIAGVGLVLAFLYNSPGKNIFLNFGTGLWHSYNMASGLLGDTLSYIRLFAIGLTGSILGGVFNTLAVDMTADMNIVARIICMFLILIIGHSINFGLCTISSLVHPLRLIFVEYYKNAEFEGGGKEYKPFKKR